MIEFEPTINLGVILTLLLIISFGFKIIKHMNSMEFKVDLMWKEFKKKFGINSDEEL